MAPHSDSALAHRCRGEGPPIVFVHGNSCSSRCFDKQLDSALSKQFRLLALDLPGHGESPPAPAPDEDYTLPGYASSIVRAAERLGATQGVFVGWSLGGHVLLEALHQLPRAAGVLIFGTPPVPTFAALAHTATADPAVGSAFRADSTDAEVNALMQLFVRPGADVPPFFAEDFQRTDGRARACLAASAAEGRLRDEVRIVAEMTQPLAIIHGMRDQMATNRAWFDTLHMPTLWRGGVQEIAEAGHAPQWETPELFNRLLEDFALECLQRR